MISNTGVCSSVRLASILLLTLTVGACGMLPSGKSSLEAVRQYTLSAGLGLGPSESLRLGTESCISAQVLLPRSVPGLNTARMAYQREPDRIEYFALNQWVDTPAYMIQPLLMKALAQSGRFEHVVMAPSSVGNRFRLEADDLALVQRFENSVNTVRLAVRLRMVDASNGRFLLDEVIELEQQAPMANPESGVATANQLARELVQRTKEAVQSAVNIADFCGR